MSATPYEDLTEEERLANSVHLKGKIGPTLAFVLDTIQHQMDELVYQAGDIIKKSFQPDNAQGDDLDELGKLFDLNRFGTTDDETYRAQILVAVPNFETVTKDSIQSLFENITGRKPTIHENFTTQVYFAGEETQKSDEAGIFYLFFEVPRDTVNERVPVQNDGQTIVLSHTNTVTAATTLVSATTAATAGDTTIYTQSVSGFANFGEVKIGNEWIRYSAATTTPVPAFTGCIRGLYDSDPESHPIEAAVEEGVVLVWPEGSNNVVYDSHEGATVTLSGGTYGANQWFNIRYRISNSNTDYDEVSELAGVINQFREMGYEYKAAGVRADINIGTLCIDWFQESLEELVITDDFSWEGETREDYHTESLDLPIIYDPPVFIHGEGWDIGHWDMDHFDDPTPPSDGYFLEIEFSFT